MIQLPASPFVESRDAGYFLAGTRISLGSIASAVGRGETVDEIVADFPTIESRSGLQGAIEFITSHPDEIDAYLGELASQWEDARKRNPADIVERAKKFRSEKALKSA